MATVKKTAARKTKKTAKGATKKAKRSTKTIAANARTATKETSKETIKTMESIMTQGKTQFDKIANDATKNGKEQIDAYMKSGNIFMKGFEDMAKTYMGWAQSSVEKNSQAVKAMLSCKTINEYAETQSKWVQQNFDDFMSGATKISELSVKVATDAFEPINDQVSKSIKKATDAVAA